jgi:hypothetical protein
MSIKTVFHGSGLSIDEFDYKWVGKGNDQLGSGWYFTSDILEAETYCGCVSPDSVKLEGLECPTVHIVDLSLNNPLSSEKIQTLTVRQSLEIIQKSPELDDSLSDWGDVASEGKRKVIERAAQSYVENGVELISTINKLSNDFFDGHIEAFNRVVNKTLGYDGVICEYEGKTHYVAWFPEQINIIERRSVNLPTDTAVKKIKSNQKPR